MKVVLNNEYGGYSLSTDILKMYLERTNTPYETSFVQPEYYINYNGIVVDGQPFYDDCIQRHDPVLIQILEGLQGLCRYKHLKIVEIPDFSSYSIGEYDGREWIENTWIEVTIDELRAGLSQERLEQVSQVDFIRRIERT